MRKAVDGRRKFSTWPNEARGGDGGRARRHCVTGQRPTVTETSDDMMSRNYKYVGRRASYHHRNVFFVESLDEGQHHRVNGDS